jgi:hypothetical protein
VSGSTGRLALAAGVAVLAQLLAFGGIASAASIPASAPEAGPAPAPASSASTPEAVSAAQPREVVLSNEETSTTWAHPVEEADIHLHPNPRSRTVARSHLVTEDGFPEVYLLLETFRNARDEQWVRMRMPGRPNGRIGWIPAADLGPFHVTHWHLVISLGGRSLKAYFNGRLRFSAPVGVGKPSTPTPTGRFWIRERFKVANPSDPYWPWALGTSAYSRLTDWRSPATHPTVASACIRVTSRGSRRA